MNHNLNQPCLSKLDIPSPNTGTEADWPIAWAHLEVCRVRGELRVRWLVLCCPRCGGRHSHGAGDGKISPLAFLSHKAPHCRIPNAGYELRDPNPRRTAALVEKLGLQ